jgi:sugar O-acyltransferase (sialic acid O-acetyltransferase NeuD family)
MSGSPLVGTVVPTHHARYLREALASLLRQTVDHDVLVVDDGSDRGECTRVARELGVPSVRNPTPTGGANARNVGVSLLRNPWILNFDHDNVAEPAMVEHLLSAALRTERAGIAYCTPRMIGMAFGPHPGVRRGTPWALKAGNFVDASSMFRREAWDAAGGFDAKAGLYADWDMWLGIVERGWRLAYVPEMLYRYRIHEESGLRRAGPGVLDEGRRFVLGKHADFVRVRHRRRPGNQVTRAIMRARRSMDGRRLRRDRGGPMKLVLVGARLDGQGGIVLDTIADGDLPYQVVAFLDETVELWGSRVEGIPVYGDPMDHLERALELGVEGGMVSIGDGPARERLSEPLVAAGLELPSIVHRRAFVSPSARIGAGVYVGPMSTLNTGSRVDDLVLIQGGVYVSHDVHVSRAATLAPGTVLGGRSRVGARCFVGLGAVVFPEVSIGDDAVVGAGAVVREDVKPGVTVVGIPARELRR